MLIRITNSFSNSNDANRISIFSDSMVKTCSIALELIEQKANASLLLTGSAGSFKRSYLVFTVTPPVFLFDSKFAHSPKKGYSHFLQNIRANVDSNVLEESLDKNIQSFRIILLSLIYFLGEI